MTTRALLAALLFAAPLPLSAQPSPAAQLGDAAAVEAPAPGLPARPAAKEWTVLVYVSARNNLCYEAINDVNEMEAAGSTDKVNVVAELARMKCEPPFNPFAPAFVPPPQADWTGSRRFLLTRDSDPAKINSPVLAQYPDADMGDWRHLAEFIKWGKANFPARKYLLVVSGHGGGWRGVKPPPGANKGISYDDVSGNHIAPAELAAAIKAAGGVTVYSSDACLMQTAEVVYDLKDAAEYVVGSQETTPGSGYNYEVFLKELAARPGDGFAAAQAILKGFSEYYFNTDRKSVTMSVVRPGLSGELALKLDRFARLVAASPEDMKLYHDKKWSLRSFDDEDARDLYQVLKLYFENSPTPAVREAARDAIVFLSEKFVLRNDALGYKSKDANGLSVYFPLFYLNYKPKYEYLTFSRDTYWDEMVKAVVESKK